MDLSQGFKINDFDKDFDKKPMDLGQGSEISDSNKDFNQKSMDLAKAAKSMIPIRKSRFQPIWTRAFWSGPTALDGLDGLVQIQLSGPGGP